jgi:altronate dehydratase small subunit
MALKRGLLLDQKDNVVNVLEEAMPGDVIQSVLGDQTTVIEAVERIPFGFKIAAKEIQTNTPIIKYGQQIGFASVDIQRGSLVHTHNMAGVRGRGDLRR